MEPETSTQPMNEEGLAELRSLINRAKAGDHAALPMLRVYLDLNPAIWRKSGDLALQAQAAWVNLVSGPNLHLRECLARRVNAMKQEWVGDSPPSPAEVLLIERIIAAWLQLNYIESREAQHGETSLKWAQFQMQRQAQAEKQLRAAIDALEAVRKARKPIAVEIRQAAVPQPMPTPDEAMYRKPETADSTFMRKEAQVNGNGDLVNGRNGSINGHNRLKGHLNGNHVADIMATIAAAKG